MRIGEGSLQRCQIGLHDCLDMAMERAVDKVSEPKMASTAASQVAATCRTDVSSRQARRAAGKGVFPLSSAAVMGRSRPCVLIALCPQLFDAA